MSVPLVEITRCGFVESRHHGSVCVVNSKGQLIASAGDPDMVTFIRSAAKPIQAINLFFSGAMEHFNFTQKELAIMCSSHYGEDMHRQVINELLDKMQLTHTDLHCGTPLSIKPSYRDEQLYQRLPIDETNSDCSGKHCGFLSVCKVKGYPIETYTEPDHPMQQEVLEIVAHMCCMEKEKIHIGIDGCGVPVHGMPLRNMAMGYARLTTPELLEEHYRRPCEEIVTAMNAYPEMIAGTKGFCTEFLKHTGGRFCGKLGAESVYCIGVRGKDMGIAVKIEDGNYRALYPAVMSTLIQLELLTKQEIESLAPFVAPWNRNDHGVVVGERRANFKLTFH